MHRCRNCRHESQCQEIDNGHGSLVYLLLFTIPAVEKYLMCHRDLHAMGMFSGMKASARVIAQKRLATEALGKTYSDNPAMGLLTSAGFERALHCLPPQDSRHSMGCARLQKLGLDIQISTGSVVEKPYGDSEKKPL